MKTIISILSEQLIPNLLFIKQLGLENYRHVFLSTARMEDRKKSHILANALNLKNSDYQVIEIDANSPSAILAQLKTVDWESGIEYIVNITGGTKVMSQMVYSCFKELPNSKIYYWPIDFEHVEQLHPQLKEVRFQKNTDLDLKTYLATYGYSFSAQTQLTSSFSRADELFKAVCSKEDSGLVKNIQNANSDQYYKSDKNYLMGGWFEEWLYYVIKSNLGLSDAQIAFNLKLKSLYSERTAESDNELDIAFVYKNALYILECKVFSAKQLSGKKITDTVYKISAVRNSLGLKATAMVAILSNFGSSGERRKALNTLKQITQVKEVFTLESMKNKHNFIKEIKKIVHYE